MWARGDWTKKLTTELILFLFWIFGKLVLFWENFKLCLNWRLSYTPMKIALKPSSFIILPKNLGQSNFEQNREQNQRISKIWRQNSLKVCFWNCQFNKPHDNIQNCSKIFTKMTHALPNQWMTKKSVKPDKAVLIPWADFLIRTLSHLPCNIDWNPTRITIISLHWSALTSQVNSWMWKSTSWKDFSTK